MRRQITITTAIMMAFGLSGAVLADEILLSPGNNNGTDCVLGENCWEENGGPAQPSPEGFEEIIFGETAGDGEEGDAGLEILYKDEANGTNKDDGSLKEGKESGIAAGDYTTTFEIAEDPVSGFDEEESDGATIIFDGDTSIDCAEGCWLWVKDGKNDPFLYIFDISYWNGTDTLHLANFWPDKGAISNLGILGRAVKSVPEPGTLGLLGLGLIGFAVSRRRRGQG